MAWAVDGADTVRTEVCRYFTEGLERGERLVFVGDGDGATRLDDLVDVPDREALLDRGQLRLQSADHTYGLVLSGDLTGQAELLQAEADRALADGFTGVRVWADVTPLTRDPALLQRFLDYELVVEKTFRGRAATGLCALDVSTAGEHWVRLASRHRLSRAWADSPMISVVVHDGVVRIAGEIDMASLVELEDALDSVARTTRGALVLDLGEVEFLDVAGARELARFVRRLVLAGREVRVGATRGLLPEVLSLFHLSPGGSSGSRSD